MSLTRTPRITSVSCNEHSVTDEYFAGTEFYTAVYATVEYGNESFIAYGKWDNTEFVWEGKLPSIPECILNH